MLVCDVSLHFPTISIHTNKHMKGCSSLNPSCTCTFCTVNFHCPLCARKSHVRTKCRFEAETRAKRDAELRAKAKLERDRLERGQADELAGAMNEFFTALYTQNADATPIPDISTHMSSVADLPVSSPDSITVTTEFGVHEETGNVTVISAAGASHPYNEADGDEYEEDHSFHPDEFHGEEDGPESYVVMTEDTSAVGSSSDWVAAVALQHQQQQAAWLLHAVGANSMVGLVAQHQEGGGIASSEEDEHDEGEEADVDTDEVDHSADDEIADGAVTPTGAVAQLAM